MTYRIVRAIGTPTFPVGYNPNHRVNSTPHTPLYSLFFALVPLLFASGLSAQTLSGFTLVDATTDRDIAPLRDGDVLDLDALPAGVTVRANTSPTTVGSVRFAYDGNGSYRTENVPPYALAGDSNGDYAAWPLTEGTHELSARAYTGSRASGTAGASLGVRFTVVRGRVIAPQPPSGLRLATVSNTSLRLSWTNAPSGNDYRVQYGTSPTFAGATTDAVYFGVKEQVYTGLAPGTTYYFRMRTVEQGVSSGYSATVSAKTGATAPESPGEPTGPGIAGELKQWHTLTLSLAGPRHSERDNAPNPFLDYRFEVTFTHAASGRAYTVPGYFAADGKAAETGASSGDVWRAHFTPDAIGTWTYRTRGRTGAGVAVGTNPDAGATVATLDGKTGRFVVTASDKAGRDLRGKGRLDYVGKHQLRFAGNGEYFLKGGPDAPENFLAYEDFDNTPNNGGYRKSWSPHARDYRAGDPSWRGGKGTEMIGALNYLAAEGMNAFSFLTMNIRGDDRNVYPYVSDGDLRHFDLSKLDQWDIVFAHAERQGMYLHFKLQETENDLLLDGGRLGTDRKLYYRMLIARFGHHLALNWNLGEENNVGGRLGDSQQNTVKSYAQYFYDVDPYRHHVVIHTYGNAQEQVYGPLLGSASRLTGVSLQTDYASVYADTRKWVGRSAAAGRPWVVANDEQNSASVGVPPYVGYVDPSTGRTFSGVSVDHADIRRETLWGNLMAGGAGVEYYFGYSVPQSDLTLQDYRSRDGMWDYTRYALDFFRDNLPFWEMTPQDGLASSGRVLAKVGEAYAVQLPRGGSTRLTLPGGEFDATWFDPRTGRFAGAAKRISGGTSVALGNPPSSTDQDWVILVERAGGEAPAETPDEPSEPTTGTTTLAINAGGPGYGSSAGVAYAADAYFSGGTGYGTGSAIANTSDDDLYRGERWGRSFGYALPVANGTYRVTLQFAEIYFGAPGRRVFDVRLEGALAVDDLDIYARAGKNAAYDVVRTVTVADGVLNVDLKASIENAKISALRVEPASTVQGRQASQAEAEPQAAPAVAATHTSTIYPNPARTVVSVRGADIARVSVLAATGQVLRVLGGGERELDVSAYAPGLYLIQVETPDGVETHRLVRE